MAAPTEIGTPPVLGRVHGASLGAHQGSEDENRRKEGGGDQPATHLLAQHRDLDRAQAETSFVLGHLEREPALVGHGRPGGGVEPARRVAGGGGGRVVSPEPAFVIVSGPGQGPDHHPRPDAGAQLRRVRRSGRAG